MAIKIKSNKRKEMQEFYKVNKSLYKWPKSIYWILHLNSVTFREQMQRNLLYSQTIQDFV